MTTLRRIVDMVVALLAGGAVALACGAVFTRYLVPALAVDWSDEVVIILLIWAMFLSGFGVTLDRAHIAVDLLSHGRTARWIPWLRRLSSFLIAAYALGFSIAGSLVVLDAWSLGERTESTLQLHTGLYYAALPVGMAVMLMAACVRLADRASPTDERSDEASSR